MFRRIKEIGILVLSSYFKNFQGPFFAFGFPILSLLIVGTIMVNAPSPSSAPNVMSGSNGYNFLSFIAGLIGLSGCSIGIVSIPAQISSFKESIIIKRIAITPIKRWEFLFSTIVIGITLTFLSSLLIIFTALIFFHKELVDSIFHVRDYSTPGHIGEIQYGIGSIFTIIIGWFALVGTGLVIGMFISGVAKNESMAVGIAMLIFFPQILLSGAALPPSLIERSSVLKYISYIFPIKYALSILNVGWLFGGQGIFSSATVKDATCFHYSSSYLNNIGVSNYLYSEKIPVWTLLLILLGYDSVIAILSIKLFKWEV